MQAFLCPLNVVEKYHMRNEQGLYDMGTKILMLRTNQTYKGGELTLTLLKASTKWTVSGDSALTATLEVSMDGDTKLEYFLSTNRPETAIDILPDITVTLLNGDNDYVKLEITDH